MSHNLILEIDDHILIIPNINKFTEIDSWITKQGLYVVKNRMQEMQIYVNFILRSIWCRRTIRNLFHKFA